MLHLDFGDTLPELGPESLDQLSDPENVNENEDIRNLSRNSGGDEVQSPHLNANKACTQNSSDLDTTIPEGDGSSNGSAEIPTELQKPKLSYVALISQAIMSSPEKRLLLGDIYKCISKKYAYYRYIHDKAWKNSIRHNLSLNECFIKNGRSPDGKGNFWSIHPACVEDFKKGDFRRRQARRRAKGFQQKDLQSQQNSMPYTNPYSMDAKSHYVYSEYTQISPGAACASTRYTYVNGSNAMPAYQPNPMLTQYYTGYQPNTPGNVVGSSGPYNGNGCFGSPQGYAHTAFNPSSAQPVPSYGYPIAQGGMTYPSNNSTANVTATQVTVAQFNQMKPNTGSQASGDPLAGFQGGPQGYASAHSMYDG